MKITIFSLIAALIFLSNCARSNDPFDPGESLAGKYLEIEMVYPTVGRPYSVDISDDYVIIAEDQAGFSIFDRSTGNLYSRVTSYNEGLDMLGNVRYVKYINIGGDHLLYTLERFGLAPGLIVFDLEEPDEVVDVSSIVGDGVGLSNYMRMFHDHNDNIKIYYTMGGANYRLFRYGRIIGDSHTQLTTSTKTFPNTLRGFDIQGNIAFIAGEQRGLYIYDMENGVILSETNVTGEALDVRVKGDYAYIVAKQEGVQVFNIQNLSEPIFTRAYDTVGWAQHIEINNNYLAVASGGGGAYLYRIEDDGELAFMQRLTSSQVDYTYRVDLRDNYLFVSGRYLGVTRARILESGN